MNDLDKKASPFLDMLYTSRGGEVIKEAPNMKFDDWDKLVKFEYLTYKIEEKSFNSLWDGLLVELIEDLKTGDLGWFYQTRADKIIYAFFINEEAKIPHSVYEVSVPTMRNYVNENIKELIKKAKICDKGYGTTLFVVIPLEIGNRIYFANDNVTK